MLVQFAPADFPPVYCVSSSHWPSSLLVSLLLAGQAFPERGDKCGEQLVKEASVLVLARECLLHLCSVNECCVSANAHECFLCVATVNNCKCALVSGCITCKFTSIGAELLERILKLAVCPVG